VNATLDGLIFDFDLMIQREVVLDIHLHLMAQASTKLSEIRRVVSFPVAWPSAASIWPSTSLRHKPWRELDRRRRPGAG